LFRQDTHHSHTSHGVTSTPRSVESAL